MRIDTNRIKFNTDPVSEKGIKYSDKLSTVDQVFNKIFKTHAEVTIYDESSQNMTKTIFVNKKSLKNYFDRHPPNQEQSEQRDLITQFQIKTLHEYKPSTSIKSYFDHFDVANLLRNPQKLLDKFKNTSDTPIIYKELSYTKEGDLILIRNTNAPNSDPVRLYFTYNELTGASYANLGHVPHKMLPLLKTTAEFLKS